MVLFNLFASILRLAEIDNLEKSRNLSEITGIILIDEIESHLHSELQYEVLPDLVSLFPKVQFLISTHSPLFVLGLEKKLGSKGVRIIDMQLGKEITSERFSEFEKSYEYYKDSVAYDKDILHKIKELSVPIIFLEGESDVIYTDSVCFVQESEQRRSLHSTPGTRFSPARSARIMGVFNTL